MAETRRDKDDFPNSPWFEEFMRAIPGGGTPILIGLGFHTLMKRSATGGFVGQLARDVAGAAVGGLPGLTLTSGSGASDFFGNVVIFLYFQDSITLVDLGYQSLVGDSYDEVTLERYCLREFRKGKIDPTITTISMKEIDIDYDKYEYFSLTISSKQPISNSGTYEYPLKITFPLAKDNHQTKMPKILQGTAFPYEIIALFHGTGDLPNPKEFIDLLLALHSPFSSSKAELPDSDLLVKISKNKYFMKNFMENYNRLFPFSRKKLLTRVFPEFPPELKESIRQQFIQYSEGKMEYSIGTKLLRYTGIIITSIGAAYLPFNATADSIGLSGFMVMLGVFLLISSSLVGDKVSNRKWYAEHLTYLEN